MDVDVIIVGRGLAGTLLAWSLRWLGRTVVIVDRESPGRSSQIAAGLITPITGRRLVLSWRWHEFRAAAEATYRRIERELDESFFGPLPIIRLLDSPDQAHIVDQRFQSEAGPLMIRQTPLVNPAWFQVDHGGFEMQGARLDVARFLESSRRHLSKAGQVCCAELDPRRDVVLDGNDVRVPALDLRARRIVFCQGIDGISNPWFANLHFKPAKGQILTVRIRDLAEHRAVTRGVWLLPLGGDLFRAGATYEWQTLDSVPTDAGRTEILARLAEYVCRPIEVVAHDAAVRPILRHQYPELGLHERWPQLAVFNGLGSKGSLQGPWLADHFARVLTGAAELDPAVRCRQPCTSIPEGLE